MWSRRLGSVCSRRSNRAVRPAGGSVFVLAHWTGFDSLKYTTPSHQPMTYTLTHTVFYLLLVSWGQSLQAFTVLQLKLMVLHWWMLSKDICLQLKVSHRVLSLDLCYLLSICLHRCNAHVYQLHCCNLTGYTNFLSWIPVRKTIKIFVSIFPSVKFW